jgi:hypothetical protein
MLGFAVYAIVGGKTLFFPFKIKPLLFRISEAIGKLNSQQVEEDEQAH